MKNERVYGLAGLALAVFVSIYLVGCGTNIHSTLALYDQSEGRRLPADSVAHILMADAIGYGVRIPRFDDRRGVGARDTLEILPGKHRMWLDIKRGGPVSDRKTATTHAMLHPSYLFLEFLAEAGHVYELKVTGFTPPGWSAELTDQGKPAKTIQGILTTRLE